MSVQTSTHWCGGTLVFVREDNGHSAEQCSGCDWAFSFGSGQDADRVRTEISRQCRPAQSQVTSHGEQIQEMAQRIGLATQVAVTGANS